MNLRLNYEVRKFILDGEFSMKKEIGDRIIELIILLVHMSIKLSSRNLLKNYIPNKNFRHQN